MQKDDESLVLGIETSCDETSLALYCGKTGWIEQIIYSQADLHALYGGVVPELAARDHIRRLYPIYQELLAKCGKRPESIDLIAYTCGPGLAGALLTGVVFARSLAYFLNIRCVGLHHMEAHLLSVNLEKDPPPTPYLALLVSGGHSLLATVEQLGDYKILGRSLDDACGEAFDKVAKLLNLGYPGGPAIAQLALQGSMQRQVRFSRPMLHKGLDMSFSGLKTQVLRHVQQRVQSITGEATEASLPDVSVLPTQELADIAAEFQECVVDVLVEKATRALEESNCCGLVVAGGVGANLRLRQRLQENLRPRGIKVFIPASHYCTDNAAMVAHLGWLRRENADWPQRKTEQALVRPRWSLQDLQPLSQEGPDEGRDKAKESLSLAHT